MERPSRRFFGSARRISAALAFALSLAGAAPARADRPPDPALPRHLALSEPRTVPIADPAPSLQLALSAALHPVAERMMDLPNPYGSALPAACDDLPEGCRRFPERTPEAAPEDPNDVMGLSLGGSAVMGLRVDLVGPIEMRETYTRLTNPRKDPTDLRNVQGSLGLRLGF